MSRLNVVPVLAVLLVFCSLTVHAQDESPYFSFTANLALPVGDFGDNTGGLVFGSGYAETGFGGSVGYHMPVGAAGLFWATNLSLYSNSIATGFYETDEVYEYSSWLNIPLMTGLQYRNELTGSVDLLLTGQVGVDFISPPETDWERGEVTSDMVTTFGFGIGAGIIIKNIVIIDIRYMSLGEADIEYNYQELPSHEGILKTQKPISMLVFSAGIAL